MLSLLSIAPVLGLIVKLDDLLPVLATTVIFVVIGLIVFVIAFFIVVLVAPFSVKKEIEEDQNTALAIIIGSLIIGVALIIALTTHAAAQKRSAQEVLTQLHSLCERDYKPPCIKLGLCRRKNSAEGSE